MTPLFVIAGVAVIAVKAAPIAPKNSLVDILRSELDREFSILKAKSDPAPYYIAYEVTDEDVYSASASLGALINQDHTHVRGFDTTVRVGTPQLDNYHPFKGQTGRFTSFTSISLNNDPNEVRRALWAETSAVYKGSANRLLQLKTDEQLLVSDKNQPADFSEETPQTYTKLPERYNVDIDGWSQRLRTWSAEFNQHPRILSASVSFEAQHIIRTLVNTEGTSIQDGSNLFRIEVAGATLAPDGMEVQDMETVEGDQPSHLPADGVIKAKVQHVADQLEALAKAPPAEPIVCPAILSGRASAVFFHEIFGHRVEGHRQKDESEGQTFTKMLGQKVLPDFLSVTFDPTRREINGIDLNGYYDYDDEGVQARPVKVVENGVLKTWLLSRSPVGEFTHSNGHGRRQPGHEVESRQSNLIVESSKQVSDQELNDELIAEVKRQGKPYGLYFEEVSNGYTTTRREGLQAFTVVPLVVYRVYPDGHRELVRGVDIVGTPLSSFQKILATSNHVEVFNGYCGAESGMVPVSAVSPAILVSEIEVQKKQNGQQQLPVLPRPEAQ
ncbi:MAG TPA: TldD/PmbA family protein [Bryobacteraceae bacterium]|nr:TldD/PmbA family protein [Bryobacteraceae bacterium]